MRHLSLILFFWFLASLSVYSQEEEYPPCSAYDTIGKDTLRAVNSYGNFLYVGIDNEILVNPSKFSYKAYFIKTTNGEVFSDEGSYIIIPSHEEPAILTIYGLPENDTVFLFSKIMEVKTLSLPYIICGGYRLSNLKYIRKQFFSSNDSFEIHLSTDFVDDSKWYSIKDITMGYTYGTIYKTLSCCGNKLSKQLKHEINMLLPGKEITLIFRVVSEGDVIKTLPAIKLVIY
jgi:hypothetical protein